VPGPRRMGHRRRPGSGRRPRPRRHFRLNSGGGDVLTTEELRRICVEHFEAENHRSVDEIIATVDDDVEYHVMSPRYPDDPEPFGVTAGAEAVRQMWVNLYQMFDPYVIEWDEDDWMVDAAKGKVFARVRITATPVRSFEGLPAGK